MSEHEHKTDGVRTEDAICTVLRRRKFARNVEFLEVVTNDARLVSRFTKDGSAMHRMCIYITSTPGCHVGDVVSVSGEMEIGHANNWRKGFAADKITVLTNWDAKTFGTFYYEPNYEPNESDKEHFTTEHFPVAMLQTPVHDVARVYAYMAELLPPDWHCRISTTVLSRSDDRIVCVYQPKTETEENKENDQLSVEAHRVTSLLQKDVILPVVVSRMYAFPTAAAERAVFHFPSEATAWTADCLPKDARVRLQMFPKTVFKEVVECEQGARITWAPKNHTHLLSVVSANGLWWASIVETNQKIVSFHDLSFRKNAVCRAKHKLSEVFLRSKWDLSPLKGSTAIDIGASPGGWSLCLQEAGCHKVFAVDSGLLQVKEVEIEHFPMKGDEAIALLKSKDTPPRISAYVCDANVPPEDSISMLESCSSLLVNGAFVVVTFKNTYRNKKSWHASKETQKGLFEGLCSDVREIHLMSNTPNETTLFGKFKKPS